MPESILGIAIISFFIVLGISSAIYYLHRFSRGSIDLSLSSPTYDPGEEIEGSIKVIARRAFTSERLVVYIYCIEGTKARKRWGRERRPNRHREVYREELVIEESRTYASRESMEYVLRFNAPAVGDPADDGSFWNPYIAEVLSNLSQGNRILLWYVQARLEMPGTDIARTKEIDIRIDPDELI